MRKWLICFCMFLVILCPIHILAGNIYSVGAPPSECDSYYIHASPSADLVYQRDATIDNVNTRTNISIDLRPGSATLSSNKALLDVVGDSRIIIGEYRMDETTSPDGSLTLFDESYNHSETQNHCNR